MYDMPISHTSHIYIYIYICDHPVPTSPPPDSKLSSEKNVFLGKYACSHLYIRFFCVGTRKYALFVILCCLAGFSWLGITEWSKSDVAWALHRGERGEIRLGSAQGRRRRRGFARCSDRTGLCVLSGGGFPGGRIYGPTRHPHLPHPPTLGAKYFQKKRS